jgi:hypothetical protein
MNIKITKQTDSQFQEDEKRPAKLILTVKRGSQPNYYLIIINHPNRNPEGQLPELYSQEHLADSMDHALNLGKHIMTNDFNHIETKFEEIKYIPAGKRGKMKLDKKESDIVVVAEPVPSVSVQNVLPVVSSNVENKPRMEKPKPQAKPVMKKTKVKKIESKLKKTTKKKVAVKKTKKKVKKNTKSLKQKK